MVHPAHIQLHIMRLLFVPAHPESAADCVPAARRYRSLSHTWFHLISEELLQPPSSVPEPPVIGYGVRERQKL